MKWGVLMVLKNIELNNFRNHKNLMINFDSNINIIHGNNGIGKTNILESIYFMLLAKSHRSSIDSNMIMKEENYCSIKGTFFNDPFTIKYEVLLDSKGKKVLIDDKEIKKYKTLKTILNVIMFFPEDLDLIKGSPIERRKYLNTQITQLNRNYNKIINNYEKLLYQRNELLKKIVNGIKIDDILFNVVTEKLVDQSILIYKYRKNYIDNINLNIPTIFSDLTNLEKFKLEYNFLGLNENIEEFEIKNYMLDWFKKNINLELSKGSTLIGSHKDDFIFKVKDDDLKYFGSQGQQRLAVISLKLAEIPIFKSMMGIYPIILLDDVFSELDIKKRNNLMNYIKNNIQSIITTTDLNDLDENLINHSKIIYLEEEVKHGKNTL